jgi:hypothetical protein
MSLRVVGAGLGRTGTLSLKVALETLLGAPCYHMAEVFPRPDHVRLWREASLGRLPDWRRTFEGFAAAVDWPASAFWKEISAAFPDALILLSVRPSDAWWKSASQTIFAVQDRIPVPELREMTRALFANRFTSDLHDRAACIAAYERHNADVRATAPRARLLEWTPGDGWEPLCKALDLPVPDAPFPRVNSTEEFLARMPPP